MCLKSNSVYSSHFVAILVSQISGGVFLVFCLTGFRISALESLYSLDNYPL